jgi:hypothetical protein
MAVAVATPSVGTQINAIDNTQKSLIVRGTIKVDAGPKAYAAGGLVCDLTPLASVVPVGQAPLYLFAWSQPTAASPNTTMYGYSFLPGTTLANGKFQIWEQSGVDDTPLDEFDDTVAIPAGVSGDTIQFEAVFAR